jgi:hypothetical protein
MTPTIATRFSLFVGTAMAVAAFAAGTTTAQAQTSVSISVNQPGVYGRVVIGDRPPPVAWVMPQPVMIAPPRIVVAREPIYLYVPPGHYQNWSRHCGRYNACGQPVVFVQDSWVRERYAEAHGRGPGHGKGHGKGRGHGRGDRDHDGVSNRDDRDRDGDGVRNRNDRRPDNRNRQ